MRMPGKLFVSVIMAITLSSCSSVLVYHMDVLRPGSFNASSDKSSILLIDNSGIQPPDFGHAVWAFSRYIQDTSSNTEPTSGFLLESVSANLKDQNCYDRIGICKRKDNIFAKNNEGDFLRTEKLTPQQVSALGDSNRVDILVSLDRFVIHSKTNVQLYDYLYRATRDVTVNTVWRVYDVNADTLLTQFQYNDSLFWERFANEPKFALNALPPIEETLPEIGDVVGGHVYKFFGPYWESVTRSYFCVGSTRMKYAADCVRQNDWEGAAALWRDEFNKGFGRSVYRAAMNMMLYSEFSGNPMDALVWGKKAEKAMDNFRFGATAYDRWFYLDYVESLQMRLSDFEKLKIYFDRK